MGNYVIINFIIGSAIAIIISVLFVLGLRIFIPAPEYSQYIYEACKGEEDQKCYERQAEESRKVQEKYSKQQKTYSGKIFISANIIGLIILILGVMAFALGLGTNIAAGVIIAGAFGVVFGYTVGWIGADDKLKFVVGLVVALIVIAGGAVVNKMKHQETVNL